MGRRVHAGRNDETDETASGDRSRWRTLPWACGMALAVAACSPGSNAQNQPVATDAARAAPVPAGRATPCAPLERREANAPGQHPTRPGQTRACAVDSGVAFEVAVLARGLDHPWSVEPLPGGGLLVTEKSGRMRIVSAAGALGEPIAGLPPVDAAGQGGLLDAALSPDFERDRTVYWSFSEPRDGGNGTSLARGVLSADGRRLEGVRVVFRALPTYAGRMHYGSRVLFGPDGMVFLTLGERSDREIRPQAQELDSHMGKILRLTREGAAAPGNPFAGRAGALPEIWTLGHRNVQAAVFDPQGRLWAIEHGAQGGDELNRIEEGRNYGWPVVAFGEEYSGAAIRTAETTRSGHEDPVYYWDPVIAPSGAEWYTGELFPAWRDSLFVGALKERRLVRLVIEGGRIAGEEHLLMDRGQRVRDVRQGPDGALYLVTDEDDGQLWRLAPRR